MVFTHNSLYAFDLSSRRCVRNVWLSNHRQVAVRAS